MSDQVPDISALLQHAQAMQQAAAEQVAEGQAAGGAVKITVTGGMEFRSVKIDPSITDDVALLEDLVVAALHDAVAKVNELNRQAMGGAFGSMFGDSV